MTDENPLTGSEQPATSAEVTAEATTPTEATEAPDHKQETATTEQPDTEKPGDESDDAKEAKPKHKSRAQERVEVATREASRLRRENARLYREIGKLQAEKPPREEDFADQSEYQRALFVRAAKEAALQDRSENLRDQFEEAQVGLEEAWHMRLAEAEARMPDIRNVVASIPHQYVTNEMADAIKRAANGVELAYYLGKNPNEAARIAALEPNEARFELGNLAARLAPPKPKIVSTAPKPVQTLSGRAAPPPSKDLNQLARTGGDDATAFIEESRRRAAARGA